MVGSPRSKKKNSGKADPIADKRKSMADIISVFLRPNFVARIPDIIPPIIQPINALEMVRP